MNEEEGGVGGDDVGGGEGVVKEEEVEEVLEEEVDIGVKRKAEEETEPMKTKKKQKGRGFAWTEEEENALLKSVGKYGLDWKRIKKEDDGNVLADRNPAALRTRLHYKFPEKYEEARGVTPPKKTRWTAEEDAALKRGKKEHGRDWEKIISDNHVLNSRTPGALHNRFDRIRK